MIINTGQRTDIPAFFSEWFSNRLKEGYVMARNPFCNRLVTKFVLNPSIVDVIGFCSKNPKPMFKYMDLLKEYGQFWYITITAFEKDLEPKVPPIDEAIKDFKYLSSIVGKNSIGWRYTPIILNEKYSIERHISTFRYIARELSGYTSLATFGFVDIYDKLRKNHPEIKDCSDENKIYISREFQKIANENRLDLRLCSKEKWLKSYGINVDGCMMLNDYENSIGEKLIPTKKMQARKGFCSCYLSNDIGAYNSCLHLCAYCYANGNKEEVIKNFSKHDPKSPLLIGHLKDDDIIKEAKQETWKDTMLTLF